jgi:hypothetical protein
MLAYCYNRSVSALNPQMPDSRNQRTAPSAASESFRRHARATFYSGQPRSEDNPNAAVAPATVPAAASATPTPFVAAQPGCVAAQPAEAPEVTETSDLDREIYRAIAHMEGADPNDPAVIAEIANRRPGEISNVQMDRALARMRGY